MSSSATICPDCGAPIPLDSPAGLCIACLLRLAQDESTAGVKPSPPEPAAKRRWQGDFEFLREIGRGGMGVVYEARQKSLNRKVALKVILAGEFASESAVTRFKEEAAVIGNLDHPNIVPIYEVGEHEGRHYYSMKLISGESLARRLERGMGSGEQRAKGKEQGTEGKGPRFPDTEDADESVEGARRDDPSDTEPIVAYTPREAAELIAKVARAVHFVHQRGIIHRDLSPENILLDAQGEPWVADFGLARLFEHGRITRTYTLLGKPDYMSPEQADPRAPDLTTASDIFSLGAVLFELLTGQRPFAAGAPLATLERVRNENPRPPSTLTAPELVIDRDLDTICLKCLAKEPLRRYSSAAALAEDLELWLRGEPILARAVGPVERSWKWIRRHPGRVALTSVSALAVLGPIVTALYLQTFAFPQQARAHPNIGYDRINHAFTLTIETGYVDRVSMNFDMKWFAHRQRPAILYFTNIPPAQADWIAGLPCQILADIPGAPDEPRSSVIRQGDKFTISTTRWRDRAYYISPLGGWKGDDLLPRAPAARICIRLLDETWPEEGR